MNAYAPGIERMMKRLFDSLRENDRRRYAAIEATKLGHGGVEYIARVSGVRSQDHSTGTDGTGRGGRRGHRTCPKKRGGRKRLIDLCPTLEENFLKVLHDHTAGDPMRADVKWTNLSRREIAKRLAAMGTPVSRNIVSSLLRKHGYRRRKAQKKKTMGPRNPNRNAQFENIARLKKEYLKAGLPVISMDTKKKELLGNFYRDGKIDTQETIETNDHDFGSAGAGVVIPTVSTMWGRTRASSTSTPATTPANWPVTAWQRGGTSKAGPTIPRPRSCWCCAMAAAATARPCICSRKTSRSWPAGWASRSAWPTTRLTARSTIRSSIACSRI